MQVKKINVQDLLGRFTSYFQENDFTRRYANEELPLRAELFNTEQLEQHGKYLALNHKVIIGKAKERLLKRLAKNEKILVEVRNLLTDAVREDHVISPAGEWLLDNFYLIEDHISTGKKHLPKGYSEGLPYLLNAPSEGLPRVYDLALEIISHSDGRIDLESLNTFINAYQTITDLRLGELWAIPIMLRLALIENLRRVAARVAIDRVNRNLADYWSSLMKDTVEKDPKSLILVIADMARSGPPMGSSFVAEMVRQLMWMGPGLALSLTWMEQRLSENGLTSNELVNIENQKQAANQVSISNTIGSLRFLGAIEWHEFVEKISAVEHTLRSESSGIYPRMDFATRDQYRHCIERIAKKSPLSENEVAMHAIRLAAEAGDHKENEKKKHVGYYLVGAGLPEVEKTAKTKFPIQHTIRKIIRKFPLSFYGGGICAISFIISLYLVFRGFTEGANKWTLIGISIFSLLAASHLATSLINWFTTLSLPPEQLPRLDFSEGIPEEYTTLVIVPSMLSNPDQTETLLEALEVRFLANRDEHLHFGLLTDFTDAPSQNRPADQLLLKMAKEGIQELNKKYDDKGNRFFLFHRPRTWNAVDKIWMGYERKRGKLTDLNSLLRGNLQENFTVIVGDLDTLPRVKYVITLDTDTQLPRDAGWKLAGAMAHPLNQPYFDEKKQRVTEGYGILQPRVSVSLPRTTATKYAQMHGNEPGIDPYTRLTSDVYQDLFSEGSFIGKGIYDIDAFTIALNETFPENRILSHDLLEGCYTRAGLLSDIQLYEEYPTSYSADVNRRHRWIRGDWQIGRWALPLAPNAKNKLRRNKLSGLSKWKIFDNLRRSLVPLAFTALLLLAWAILPNSVFWTLTVLTLFMLPQLLMFIWSLIKKPKHVSFGLHITYSIKSLISSLLQNGFMFACMPYEAYYNLDAIFRTLWRMFISHRKLLEWVASGHQEHTSDKTIINAYRSMWVNPAVVIATSVYITIFAPLHLIAAIPVLALWALAPFFAWNISRPRKAPEVNLSKNQITFLRKTARKTWGFFEQFAGPLDNWLPPDNYQEKPNNVIAHRTSPTNIGLALLSNLTAYDFGFITSDRLLKRTAYTLNTLETMERYQGHFYNWYDTISLKPLAPKYVSTVDSGNMAGHLLTLRQGLLFLPFDNINWTRIIEGLNDTVNIIRDEIPGNAHLQHFTNHVEHFSTHITSMLTLPAITKEHIKRSADHLLITAGAIADSLYTQSASDAFWWANSLLEQCKDVSETITYLFPWLSATEHIPAKFQELYDTVNPATLQEIAMLPSAVYPLITKLKKTENTPEENDWLDTFRNNITNAAGYATEQILNIGRMANQCVDFADLNYEFLYDKAKNLLSIGYNADDHRRDSGFYDLLASEAILCNFVAIAQGKLPQESWFALGRLLTNTEDMPVLLSWSGSMFEYLMPLLVMPTYDNTLISQTHKAVVARQIAYGRERGVPWGISESGYNMVDANLNYQYHAFGVPGLGLKRGLEDNLVIAPYASALALMVAPEAACKNMELMSHQGFSGRYGLYEAIDYTPSRLPRGQSFAIVQSFMSHHQGMSFLSIAYLLLGKPMQKRFTAELQFQATMLLLQERIPKTTVFYAHATDIGSVPAVTEDIVMKVIDTPNTPIPEVQLLSNGRYHVMITNAGGGYSRWNGLALTRWREDATCDNWGTFCYLRDIEDGAFWSNTYQPTLKQPKNYEVTFVQGRAEFRRRDHYIDTHTELVVSPEDDIEMRRIRITNHSRRPRIIEVTSYCEVVLTSAMSDAVHPAFSNLFVQTDILDQRNAILCTRRARGVDEHPPSMFHLMTHNGGECIETSYETDRMKFIGRGKTVAEPMVMIAPGALSNTQGSVLDPIASIRYLLAVQPDETVTIDMITGAGESKEICHALIDKYQDKHHKDRVFEMAWTHSQVVLRQINATESDAQIYSQLASSIIYTNQSLRADPAVIQRNQRGQSGLWGYSISGDLPIVLVEITEQANLELVKQMVQAHAYWRLKGLATDLVIWNEDHGGYRQVLQNQILGLIATGAGTELTDQPGGIFVRASDQISNEDRLLFQAVARINISDKRGMLDTILNQQNTPRNPIPFLTVAKRAPHTTPSVIIPEGLIFFNGFGGFMPGGKEYCIITKNGSASPAPWVNVLANPEFGTVISESGQAYTWSENAHEYRLSPWENDPVCDKSGEAFYIRDEETGHFWSPSPLPAAGTSPYITRHGFGYSIFEHNEDAIACEMQVFVDIEAPVKFVIIKLTNLSEKQRRISATGFIEWVLGDIKPKTAMHIIAEQDMGSGVMFARNPYNKEFEGRVAFFDTDDSARTVTADRTEFLGRNGTLKNPDAMGRARLSGKTGAALDPCAAIQTTFTLQPGQVREVIFRLGAGKNLGEAKNLAAKYKGTLATYESLSKVRKFWEHTLSSLQIETPNQSLNILTNGWLMYQTLASRLWARSGYYQSGGAFGFRDQLQDVVALTQSQPAIARHQILLCASRQFLEGDVQHWWHPPVGRGVRTRCSDDLLWLPYVTSAYIQRTGDNAILDESVEFLDGRLLNPGEESYYDLPAKSGLSASLYQHCVRAIEQGMKFGSRGLPLFGSGDWNDGMDQVGKEGKGESIWLGFFLYDVLTRFTPIATDRRDNSFADKCTKEAGILQANIEKNGWDGNWYRRGYFDDGKPLGSSKNDECQVDSISQSWAIISGAGNAERTAIALASADKRLVKPDGMFIQLLDPPFDKSAMNPGYIKGYVPGIRENGGQYTHAAVWMIMAYAASGNAKRAWELMEMINPLNHGSTAEKIAIYKTEPYVVAADIYSVTQNFGRGGWTWYTGSAGWMYQLIIDWLIGIKRDGNKLRFTPCLPEEWNDCTVNYRFQETTYQINFKNNTPGIGTIKIIFDGEEMPDNAVYLADDKKTHVIEVRIFSDKLYSPQKVSISAAAGVA